MSALTAGEVLEYAGQWSACRDAVAWLQSLDPESPCPNPPNLAWVGWFGWQAGLRWSQELWEKHEEQLAEAVASSPSYACLAGRDWPPDRWKAHEAAMVASVVRDPADSYLAGVEWPADRWEAHLQSLVVAVLSCPRWAAAAKRGWPAHRQRRAKIDFLLAEVRARAERGAGGEGDTHGVCGQGAAGS
jgi:hypothetical protein